MAKVGRTTVKLDASKAVKLLEPLARAGMERACTWVAGFVKSSFKPGTGRRYKRGKGRWHVASVPGVPPAVDSGRLRSSITYQVETTGSEVRGLIGTNVEYARRLEFGFAGVDSRGRKYRQGARPFLRPAVYNNKDTILHQFQAGAKGGGGA